ncbi:hypothetical protein [Lyngbya confervoides]|uniref:YbjN domain-containing protein n=1 Tax=Lyngbya confervoides BDU141951 TaxID=1574623 RepID=A0ABD4T2A7_9CYAN|nr:hypothetical protein [Lyngbya confervoides]MCM1982654.1 hypothetical protein [Lyngbya confervoides BDU141951]
MGATLEQIATYLDHRQLSYDLRPERFLVVVRVPTDDPQPLTVVVKLEEEGQFFKVFVPQVVGGVQTHPHKMAILQTMLIISWETKMLQWEYDPSDGEIRAIIEFPLEDSTLTEQQFDRCFDGLVEMVADWALPRLQEVMATGYDPGDADLLLGEQLLLTIQEESPGMLTLLERAMEARKHRGNFHSKRD